MVIYVVFILKFLNITCFKFLAIDENIIFLRIDKLFGLNVF